MYNTLAKYYDVLVKDNQATQMWVDFFNAHKYNKTVLELASGTGEITLALAKDYLVDASDLSLEMLEEIKVKDDGSINRYLNLDMTNLKLDQTYDNIICFCDSINYVLETDDLSNLFKTVYRHLNKNGVFMFDMHSPERLDEFEEAYIEVGSVLDTDFQWTIQTDRPYILHHFAFYTEDGLKQERHIQRVYDYNKVIKNLENIGFELSVYTDFNQKGINKGEKIFIVGRKL